MMGMMMRRRRMMMRWQLQLLFPYYTTTAVFLPFHSPTIIDPCHCSDYGIKALSNREE